MTLLDAVNALYAEFGVLAAYLRTKLAKEGDCYVRA